MSVQRDETWLGAASPEAITAAQAAGELSDLLHVVQRDDVWLQERMQANDFEAINAASIRGELVELTGMGQGGYVTGGQPVSTTAQLTHFDVVRMTPEEVVAAQARGQLRNLLTGTWPPVETEQPA